MGEPWIDSNKPMNENRTSWSHIEQIYVRDNSMTFRAMSHIKHHHISPTNKEKMKVNYAAQILSSRMAGAIRNAVHHNDLPSSAEITAEFCFRFNRLFDICNATKECDENNEWKSAYRGEQSKIDFLTEMKDYISRLKIMRLKIDPSTNQIINETDATKRFNFLRCWPITISAIIELSREFLRSNS